MDRTVKSPVLQHLLQACPVPGLAACLAGVERDFGEHAGDFPALAEKYEVEMPIITEVNRVLFEGKSAAEAVMNLMLRDKKVETPMLPWENI